MRKFGCLPKNMQNDAVYQYYMIVRSKRLTLFLKRLFDLVFSFVLICVLIPIFFVVAVAVKLDSKGPVFYKQSRVTQYGKKFNIYKFRTMVERADMMGMPITMQNDKRITKAGRFLRKYRIDELPQLFNILFGNMSFVGARPEVERFVAYYTDEMWATLLLPAGVTSLASIYYKDENKLLIDTEHVEEIYIQKIMPAKMQYNLRYLKDFGLWNDICIMLKTLAAVFGKNTAVSCDNGNSDLHNLHI